MNEGDFNNLVDATFASLEEALDGVESDLDYDNSGGVLTVEFDNDSTMVFSRQPPLGELWLAARSGGYHFRHDAEAGDWRGTRDGQLLRPFVVAQFATQAGVTLEWE